MSTKIINEYELNPNIIYKVKIDSGQGSFSIGLKGMNPKEFDVLIKPTAK